VRCARSSCSCRRCSAWTAAFPEPLRDVQPRTSRRALDAWTLDEARRALARRPAAAPGRPDVGYDLACVEAWGGQIEQAFAAISPLAAAGLVLVRVERQRRRRVYRVEHARLGLATEWLAWFDRPAAAHASTLRMWGR
jgi:hypothetical protein